MPPFAVESVPAETTPPAADSAPLRLVRVRIPVDENDEVAVAPKRAIENDPIPENSVDDVDCVRVELPVTPSVPATDTLPALSIVVVAVAPKRDDAAERLIAYKLVPVALVKVSPPLRLRSVVVAFEGKR